MTAAIVARDLTRHFGHRVALEGLDLTVHRGEVLALLGPNGAGKTTTVRLLDGVLRPDRGSATVLGLDPVSQGREVRRRTGVLTENAGLDDRLTARENLEFTARLRGVERREARRRAGEALERFGMAELADRRTVGFSTGQRKRVALARALLHDPELLFLDEPTSGLDPAATRAVTDLIGALARERGRTVVLATHFLGEAGRVADRMAVLHEGRLHAVGRPDELAAELWSGIPARIDLGRPATAAEVGAVAASAGVVSAAPRSDGLDLVVADREGLAAAVALLVARGVAVYGARLRRAEMEDVYFALQARLTGAASTLPPPGPPPTTPDGSRGEAHIREVA
ncbi:MAG: ABC transporter ATP-binding protein [Actinomyces sp.]|nr:MAG: ABC transporter ATP-binding protein [Actinomyces sp.]